MAYLVRNSVADFQSIATEFRDIVHCSFQTLAVFLPTGSLGLYVELWDDADAAKTRKAKAASKTKYTCPDCAANAWAKPGTRLICGDCEVPMEPEDGE